MIYDQTIEGSIVLLRAVTEEDASFLLRIRSDKSRNAFVHQVENDLEKERRWIREQMDREGDYFFSIIRKADMESVGNISICVLNGNIREGELGRWVSYGNAVENLESVLLAHDFAFSILQMENVSTFTILDNTKVVSFWKRFGGRGEVNSDGEFVFYQNVVEREEYENRIRARHRRLLEV